MKPKNEITDREIASRILVIRGQKVMLDRDLAIMYGVETKYLKRQVTRNAKRFPEDFMFLLSKDEIENLRCHFGTSRWGGARYSPMAFTEHGIAQLSGVLKSPQAIQVNIAIIRIFIRMRELLQMNKDILLKLEQMEQKLSVHDRDILQIFKTLRQLLQPPPQPRRRVGYKISRDGS
jgi:hypothetical protein